MMTYVMQFFISITLLIFSLGTVLRLSNASLSHFVDPIFIKVILFSALPFTISAFVPLLKSDEAVSLLAKLKSFKELIDET